MQRDVSMAKEGKTTLSSTADTLSTKALYGVRVVGGRSGDKRIGKVRRFVFHPTS